MNGKTLDFGAATNALELGLAHLARTQLPDGQIPIESSAQPDMSGSSSDGSIFATSIGAYCLRFVRNDLAEKVAANALAFLQAEMAGPGLWSYWSSKSPIRVPVDLDDVSCASLAFLAWGRILPDNVPHVLANTAPDGRFRTWVLDCPWNPSAFVLPPRHHLNVDPVVNANVVAYLGERRETEAAVRYVAEAVEAQPPQRSDYYPDDCALYYAASRAFQHGASGLRSSKARVVQAIEARMADGSLDSPLLEALALATLLNFDAWSAAADTTLQRLVAEQDDDGGWRSSPGYLGPAPYYGSRALTTAYAIEAVSRWLDANATRQRATAAEASPPVAPALAGQGARAPAPVPS